MKREKVYKLREMIEKAAVSLSDEDSLQAVELFPVWAADTLYEVGVRIRYHGVLYKVVQQHTSQSDWTPDVTPALYVEVAEPGTIPVWKQPSGAQDAYMKGDKVHYPDADGPVYESTVDNNVWDPLTYGWVLVQS